MVIALRPNLRRALSWLPAALLVSGALLAAPKSAHADPFDALARAAGTNGGSTILAQGTAPAKSRNGRHRHGKSGDLNVDLTTLSLAELMELEIVPINVLGGHTHPAGQWMVGYRAMFMHMGENLRGTDEVTTRRLLRKYVTAPEDMDMQMHMLEGMYAPTDDLTLMLMVPYVRQWMGKVSLLGGGHHGGGGGTGGGPGGGGPIDGRTRFEQRSAGWGDLTLMSLYTFYRDPSDQHRLLFNGGLSIPTGSINQTHNGVNRHEYMMQLGSGTVDLIPGLTYLGETENWSWGAQSLATLRMGRNDVDYALGNRFKLNAWGSYRVADWISPSIRLEGQVWGNIRGRDRTLDVLEDPTNDAGKQGGRRVDLLLGLNLYAPKGKWKGARLNLEGGFPIYQSLDGPQLESDWQFGLSVSFTR